MPSALQVQRTLGLGSDRLERAGGRAEDEGGGEGRAEYGVTRNQVDQRVTGAAEAPANPPDECLLHLPRTSPSPRRPYR